MIIATEQTAAPGQEAERESTYQYLREADGIFRHKETEWLHERPTINGKRTWRSLNTKNLKLGKEEYYRRRAAVGRGENPYAEVENPAADTIPPAVSAAQSNPRGTSATGAAAKRNNSGNQEGQSKAAGLVGDALRLYYNHDCPDRHRNERPQKTIEAEQTNIEILLTFWDKIEPEKVKLVTCDVYHDARVPKKKRKKGTPKKITVPSAEKYDISQVPKIERGKGDRTVDLELNTLRNALRYGCRCDIIDYMPLAEGWPRYHPASKVEHCRKFMCHDTNEVHKVGGLLFGHGKTKVLGFQFVFENYTGLRTEETLQLKTDAEPFTPGWITPDGKSLCVRRAKGQEDVNPFCLIHEGLKEWLAAHKKWKKEFYPDSPWFFPSPYDPSEPVDVSALCKALVRFRKPTGRGKKKKPAKIKRKITSHAGRAFYVTVRRSWGILDVQIAFEIGHTSGGKTLADVYGGVPPHWLIGDGPKMSWLPTGKRAWE